jgi:hypothetical protein
MRCLYCLERGASSDAVAVCPSCGAAACVDHVVRAIVPVGITSERTAGQQVRGPLRCHYCAGLLTTRPGPLGTTWRRVGAPGFGAMRARLPHWRARRPPALTAADAEAAVRAAERLLLGPTDPQPAPTAVSRRGLWRRLWSALRARQSA